MPDEHALATDAAPLSRAAVEAFAASAAAGTDAWAARVVRALSTEAAASAAEGRDSERRAVVALAVGAVHRARGGLAMQVRCMADAWAMRHRWSTRFPPMTTYLGAE